MRKSQIFGWTFGGLLLVAAMIVAQTPEQDISPAHHPNLAAAQHFVHEAWEKVQAAQVENKYDMHGHASKAKELLEAANKELKMAAETASLRDRK